MTEGTVTWFNPRCHVVSRVVLTHASQHTALLDDLTQRGMEILQVTPPLAPPGRESPPDPHFW